MEVKWKLFLVLKLDMYTNKKMFILILKVTFFKVWKNGWHHLWTAWPPLVENNNFLSFSGSKKTTLCNNKRLARTWLDEFEILYNFTLSSANLKEDCGTPNKMLKIKKELKCKPFHWYLQNVYPELTVSILLYSTFFENSA